MPSGKINDFNLNGIFGMDKRHHDREDLRSVQDRSPQPHRRRLPTWTVDPALRTRQAAATWRQQPSALISDEDALHNLEHNRAANQEPDSRPDRCGLRHVTDGRRYHRAA